MTRPCTKRAFQSVTATSRTSPAFMTHLKMLSSLLVGRYYNFHGLCESLPWKRYLDFHGSDVMLRDFRGSGCVKSVPPGSGLGLGLHPYPPA